jgi:hypothetical protein
MGEPNKVKVKTTRPATALTQHGQAENLGHNIVRGKRGATKVPLHERMARYTDKTSDKLQGCWLWTGAGNEFGYGQIWDGDKLRAAHAIAYELATGKSALGKIIGHSCETRNCVNPAHLEAITASENAQWHRKRTLKLLDDRRRLVEALRHLEQAYANNHSPRHREAARTEALNLLHSLGEAT